MTARQQIRVGRLGRERSPIDAQPAPSLGEMLQAAREKKGVDLYRAERDTKIRARHLAALESGDYTELPGSVYTKGFLRNYALYLGLDPEELLTRWRDEQDFGRRGEPVAVTAPPQPIAEPRRGLKFTPGIAIAAVLSVIVILFAGYIGLQLMRFSQVPAVVLQGDRVVTLAPDARTVILRGTAGPHAVVNIAGANGVIVRTVSADDAGTWVAEVDVNKGQNDFSLVARDPDTGRDSPPLLVTVTVPVPATPAPLMTPAPAVTPVATLVPGATPTIPPTPGPDITPAAPGAAAQLSLAAPEDLATVENDALEVSGASDASAVGVTAIWFGPAGQADPGQPGDAPAAQDPQTLKVRDGAFRGSLVLPGGRWIITVTTAGDGGLAPTTATRTVDVRHAGLFATVEARTGSAWIRVWVDGEIAEEGHTFRKGEVAEFTAKRSVVVSTGNAGATYVVINGAPQDALGANGQIATVQYEKGKEPRPLN